MFTPGNLHRGNFCILNMFISLKHLDHLILQKSRPKIPKKFSITQLKQNLKEHVEFGELGGDSSLISGINIIKV